VEVADRQEVGFAGLDPLSSGHGLTLRAVAVATGVIGNGPVTTRVARVEVASQGGRTALLDCLHDAALLWRQRRAVGEPELEPVPTKDVSDFQRRTRHRCWRACRGMPEGLGGSTRSAGSPRRRGTSALFVGERLGGPLGALGFADDRQDVYRPRLIRRGRGGRCNGRRFSRHLRSRFHLEHDPAPPDLFGVSVPLMPRGASRSYVTTISSSTCSSGTPFFRHRFFRHPVLRPLPTRLLAVLS